MKKFVIVLSLFALVLSFASCSKSAGESSAASSSSLGSENDTNITSEKFDEPYSETTKTNNAEFNTVVWEGVEYEVNPVLSNSENIGYIDTIENNGVEYVEFAWDYSTNNGEGYRKALIMFYDTSMRKNAADAVICSMFYEFNDTNEVTKWSYFGKHNNLVFYTMDYVAFDSEGYAIGFRNQDGTFSDLENNNLDITSLDPSFKVIDYFT